jgi:hypothetical protein
MCQWSLVSIWLTSSLFASDSVQERHNKKPPVMSDWVKQDGKRELTFELGDLVAFCPGILLELLIHRQRRGSVCKTV